MFTWTLDINIIIIMIVTVKNWGTEKKVRLASDPPDELSLHSLFQQLWNRITSHVIHPCKVCSPKILYMLTLGQLVSVRTPTIQIKTAYSLGVRSHFFHLTRWELFGRIQKISLEDLTFQASKHITKKH